MECKLHGIENVEGGSLKKFYYISLIDGKFYTDKSSFLCVNVCLKFNPVIAEIILIHHISLYCMLISFAAHLVPYEVALHNHPLVLFSLDASQSTNNS